MYEEDFIFCYSKNLYSKVCVLLEMSLQPQFFKQKLLVAGLFSKSDPELISSLQQYQHDIVKWLTRGE